MLHMFYLLVSCTQKALGFPQMYSIYWDLQLLLPSSPTPAFPYRDLWDVSGI